MLLSVNQFARSRSRSSLPLHWFKATFCHGEDGRGVHSDMPQKMKTVFCIDDIRLIGPDEQELASNFMVKYLDIWDMPLSQWTTEKVSPLAVVLVADYQERMGLLLQDGKMIGCVCNQMDSLGFFITFLYNSDVNKKLSNNNNNKIRRTTEDSDHLALKFWVLLPGKEQRLIKVLAEEKDNLEWCERKKIITINSCRRFINKYDEHIRYAYFLGWLLWVCIYGNIISFIVLWNYYFIWGFGDSYLWNLVFRLQSSQMRLWRNQQRLLILSRDRNVLCWDLMSHLLRKRMWVSLYKDCHPVSRRIKKLILLLWGSSNMCFVLQFYAA